MTSTRPNELKTFLDLLTQDAPRGYKPWLFRVEGGSKAPDLSYGSWKDEGARLDRDEAIRWMQSGGNVGIAGRPDGPLINVDIDDEDATTIDDLKPTLIARSRSRTGVHAWYFEAAGADIPNIPTEEAGEVRANWQYVVAPGSYVETDPDAVPDDEREHAGYYTVERADAVTSLRLSELPEVFQEHNNPDPDAQDIEVPDRSEFASDDTGDQSALFDISARDVVRREGGGSTNPGDRWTAIFHGSDTGKNMSLSGRGQLHCWRHEVAHNGLQALAVLSDYNGGCKPVGAGHKQSGAGSSCLHHEDGAHIWHAWKYAKQSGYIPEDDPVPYSALKHVCRERGICPESEIPDEYDPDSADGRLPEYAYNGAVESIKAHDGLKPGRQRTDASEDTGTPDTEELAARETGGGGSSGDGGDDSDDPDDDTIPDWGEIYTAYQNADGDESDMPRYQAAMRLLEESDWRTLKETDDVYHYDAEAGIFRPHGDKVLRQRLGRQLKEQYSGHERREVLEHLYSYTTVPQAELGGDDWHICTENCVLELNGAGRVAEKEHSPKYDFLGRVQTEYNPDADCPRFQQFLDESVRTGTDKKKLQEYAGYALMHWALPHHKALFLVGPTASGKSTFLDTIRTMLGDDSVASLTPQQMTAERFGGAELFGAWANIRNDIPNELIENTGEFKELVAGDPVKAEKKYQDPFKFEPKAKHMFSANELPDASTDDRAFYRRILLVAFPHETPRDERDHALDDKLQSEHAGILNWALTGLQRLLDQGGFTGDRNPWQTEETWEKWSDSAKRFYQACLEEDPGDDLPTGDVWQAYLEYCDTEGIPAKSRQAALTKSLKTQGIETGRVYDDGSRRRALLNATWTDRGRELFKSSQGTASGDDESSASRLGGYGE
jgi:P4 family phage/plasmid primase-like protien